MKKILLVLLVFLFLCGCSNGNSVTKSSLDQIIEEGNFIVLDVRTAEEYKESHVVDSVNIPHTEINESITLDKTKTILVYCQSGGRSKIAKDLLEDLGYSVYDLGGYESVDMPKE